MDRRQDLIEKITANPAIDPVRKAAKIRELNALPSRRVAAAYVTDLGKVIAPLEPKGRTWLWAVGGALAGMPIGVGLWLTASAAF